ncbi:MAG: CBS domain-containing protein [Gammaproteobacteria bacterium]|nr:CBS domain-containing protein [Gammaproteobacteria bacterium]MBU1725904.1 CBS domain-containing protein [Gammaproteobacteria bacterium]MBU2006390.1 CBS domain-containing protein [Gammaproteobacteria bacterium]
MLHVHLTELACPALTVPGNASIRTVAARMTEVGSRVALVLDANSSLQGIITDMDLRSRVLAAGLDSATEISAIMTPDPLIVSAEQTAAEALLLMARRNIRHILVTLPDSRFGVVSVFDLLRQYDYNAAWLVGDIHVAPDVDALARLSQHLPPALVRMVQYGVAARDIAHSLSLVGQEIVHRLLKLAEARFGSPPIPYAFIVAGSMGRHEQTIHTDQDNAMILDDAFVPQLHDAYFRELAQFVSDGLAACGYVYCPGDIMATNQQWRQPLRVWKEYFAQWVETPEPQALVNATIFFDLRCAYGEESLWCSLRDDLLVRTRASRLFQTLLAENAQAFQPPLTFWKGLAAERNADDEKVIDLKKRGVVPVIDLARVYALTHGLPQVNTFERLDALANHGVLNRVDVRDLQEALESIGSLRLRHQARQVQQGVIPDNALPLASLSSLERRHLRDACEVVAGLQQAMFRRYRAV